MVDILDTGAAPSEASAQWVSSSEATAYFLLRHGIGTLWTDLDATAATALLTTAQKDLEQCGAFVFEDSDGDSLLEAPTDAMKNAVCEQAMFRLLDEDADTRSALMAQGVAAAGIVQETYNSIMMGSIPVSAKARGLLSTYQVGQHTGSFKITR